MLSALSTTRLKFIYSSWTVMSGLSDRTCLLACGLVQGPGSSAGSSQPTTTFLTRTLCLQNPAKNAQDKFIKIQVRLSIVPVNSAN